MIANEIYELPILEILFLNNNKLKEIDAEKIVKMKHLTTLNLQNNDIGRIAPELGKATQLKSLQLEGNAFRIPTQQVLAKGTVYLLEYLRDKLAES